MKKVITLGFTLVALFIFSTSIGQTEAELYQQGLKYKKQINNKKMLPVFKKLVEMDSTNVDYLSNLSFAYSKVGANLADAKLQLKFYAKAKSIASTAKKINDNHAF